MTDRAGATDRVDALAAALRMMAAMAELENVAALLRQGLALCARVLDCDRGLLVARGDGGLTRTVEHTGTGGPGDPFSTTALRMVDEQDEPLLISDTVGNEELAARDSISSHDIRSVLCTKLDMGDAWPADSRLYLYLDSHTDRRPFVPADLEQFRILSGLMASLARRSDLLARQEAAIEELRSRVEERQFDDLVYGSEPFRKCLTLVHQGAPTGVPVLLVGETGTGKEKLARIVHKLSPRAAGPFLAVNCGAIPASLVESHLFGHEKGAFTGAVAARKGYFEEAGGGTLFLDEIGELPADAQAHFLRVLQEGEITRVGSARPVKVDVRVVAATNVDLEKAVSDKSFRQDLYYRLNVLPVRVPPVRERGEDSLLLAQFFLKLYAGTYGLASACLSRDAEKAILMHDWPGNVREIQNRVQRAVITSGGPTLTAGALGLDTKAGPAYSSLREAREAVDREMIAMALSRAPGNLTNAGRILGIDRKSLRILLEKYGIDAGGGE